MTSPTSRAFRIDRGCYPSLHEYWLSFYWYIDGATFPYNLVYVSVFSLYLALDWAMYILVLLFTGLKFDFRTAKLTPTPFSFPIIPLETMPPLMVRWTQEVADIFAFFLFTGGGIVGLMGKYLGNLAFSRKLSGALGKYCLDIRVSFCNFGNP